MEHARRSRRRVLLAVGIALFGVTLVWQVWTPRRVDWTRVRIGNCDAEMANGLVLQQENGDSVWAVEGYEIYRSVKGAPFERVASLRPPFGEAWGGYFRVLRSSYGYQELAEVVPLSEQVLLVFAGGAVYRVDVSTGAQTRVLTLRYFGRGKGRGVMSRIAVDDQRRVYFGEYPSVDTNGTIRLWRGDDDGRSWKIAYEFPAGEVRHIHGVEWDPFGHALWIMTGDPDPQPRLGYSTDGGEHFTWIGSGQQRFRACGLIFTPDAVFWATDAWEDNHVYRWRRDGTVVDAVAALGAQSLYAESLDGTGGLVALSTTDAAALVVRADGEVRMIARFAPKLAQNEPLPGVRLARGGVGPREWVHFSALRTKEYEAALFRIPVAELSSCTTPYAP